MKITKKQLIISILSIFILLVSLAVTLCDVLIPLYIWIHPALTFFFCAFALFGALVLIVGIINRSAWFFLISALLVGMAIFYALFNYVVWWLDLIILIVVWAIFAITSFILNQSKTESIALNNSADYKNYEQRKLEKEEAEKNEQPKELPKLKSFKD